MIRSLTPAPDFAQAFLEAHAEAATREAELPAHQKLHLALVDERGQPLDQGDDLLALKARSAEAAQRAFVLGGYWCRR